MPTDPFILRPISEQQIRDFVSWTYDPPYDIYNIAPEGQPAEVAEHVAYFLHPAIRCHAIEDEEGQLMAFCTFGQDGQVPGGDYREQALDIGLGVRPDLTGQGNGSNYVQAVLAFASEAYQPRAFRVTIAKFNQRAQRVWEKQGFQPIQNFRATGWTQLEFVIYRRIEQHATG